MPAISSDDCDYDGGGDDDYDVIMMTTTTAMMCFKRRNSVFSYRHLPLI
jgi:hypothetical protein